MNLKLQKSLASKTYKVGKNKVKIDFASREDIKNAITKADIRSLVEEGAIKILSKVGTSRHRARTRAEKRKKGRMRGHGRRKGKATARTPSKTSWINRVRLQRKILSEFKSSGRLTSLNHRMLYLRSKGGFFRSRKHLLQYLEQNKLLEKRGKTKK